MKEGKEYFEKLNEVFLTKKYKPNPIHNEIFKVKPTHIVTTNYDTLLEEARIATKIEMIHNSIKVGVPIEKIAEATESSVEEVNEILKNKE